MLSDKEKFVSAMAVSFVSPISKEISDEARKIILKHIRDTYCPSVTDEEWTVIYDDVKEILGLFEENAFHGIVAHVSGVRVSLPKKKKITKFTKAMKEEIVDGIEWNPKKEETVEIPAENIEMPESKQEDYKKNSRIPEYEIVEDSSSVKLANFPEKPDHFKKVSTSIQEKIRKLDSMTKPQSGGVPNLFDKIIDKVKKKDDVKSEPKEKDESSER